jgi:hypothetical protein
VLCQNGQQHKAGGDDNYDFFHDDLLEMALSGQFGDGGFKLIDDGGRSGLDLLHDTGIQMGLKQLFGYSSQRAADGRYLGEYVIAVHIVRDHVLHPSYLAFYPFQTVDQPFFKGIVVMCLAWVVTACCHICVSFLYPLGVSIV